MISLFLQKLVLRAANVRALPDGGTKLHDNIAELTNQISRLDISIKRQQQVAAANKGNVYRLFVVDNQLSFPQFPCSMQVFNDFYVMIIMSYCGAQR